MWAEPLSSILNPKERIRPDIYEQAVRAVVGILPKYIIRMRTAVKESSFATVTTQTRLDEMEILLRSSRMVDDTGVMSRPSSPTSSDMASTRTTGGRSFGLRRSPRTTTKPLLPITNPDSKWQTGIVAGIRKVFFSSNSQTTQAA